MPPIPDEVTLTGLNDFLTIKVNHYLRGNVLVLRILVLNLSGIYIENSKVEVLYDERVKPVGTCFEMIDEISHNCERRFLFSFRVGCIGSVGFIFRI